jgi:hypothetical protein
MAGVETMSVYTDRQPDPTAHADVSARDIRVVWFKAPT